MDFLSNEIFLVALTLGVFCIAQKIQKKTDLLILNPILTTIVLMITYLTITDLDYQTYERGGKIIEFWLKLAIVALGVPLYLHLETIKKQFLPIVLSQIAGCIIGIISVILVADLLGATNEVIISLAPKSVTAPIAMEITSSVGGISSLTAAVVVCVGIFGAIYGRYILKIGHISTLNAMGLSMGTASHAVGTSAAMLWNERCGAFSGLGLILNGILTAILTPYILKLFNYI